MDRHFELADQDMKKIQSYFNSAVTHLTQAILEKDAEYKDVKRVNTLLQARVKYLEELILLLVVCGLIICWYVSS